MDTEPGVIMSATPRQATRWWSLAAVALATFVTSLDNTVVNAALLAPTTLAIISTAFPRERERNLAVAAWSAIAALALALGPLVGGLLAQHWHWSWIFFINVPVGVLTLAVGRLAIGESRADATGGGLDLPGLGASTVGLFALTYALIAGQDRKSTRLNSSH